MVKVYIAGPIPEVGLNLLKDQGIEVDMYEGKGMIDKETLKEGLIDADALISLLSTNVDIDVIDAANNLQISANSGAGFNNIDGDYARQHYIDVTNTPKASTNSTAELTVG
ncbi:hydroxyacid dehydrogenase, partial [Klebsiella michiganensis]|nr:hydroxyacid dehydrogenase [Klebsiella michiganensis]